MNIHLRDNYYLRSDSLNYMPSQLVGTDKEGKPVYKALAYHSTLSGALQAFVEQYIRESDATTWQELKVTLDAVHADIAAIRNGLDPAKATQ